MLDKSSKRAGRVLLPDYVTPTQYDLKLTPDLHKFTFDGVVSIAMATSATAAEHKTIVLHANELLFHGAKLVLADGKTVAAEEVSARKKGKICQREPFLPGSFD
jgi:aminopeptidase N